jgi:hypothetical protein
VLATKIIQRWRGLKEQISALSRRLGDKWCRYVLTRLASAFRANRMGDLMFREMFSVFEQLATFLATILVRRHCASPTRIPPALASYGSPALSGSLKINSSAANAQTYASSQPVRAGLRRHPRPALPLAAGSY